MSINCRPETDVHNNTHLDEPQEENLKFTEYMKQMTDVLLSNHTDEDDELYGDLISEHEKIFDAKGSESSKNEEIFLSEETISTMDLDMTGMSCDEGSAYEDVAVMKMPPTNTSTEAFLDISKPTNVSSICLLSVEDTIKLSSCKVMRDDDLSLVVDVDDDALKELDADIKKSSSLDSICMKSLVNGSRLIERFEILEEDEDSKLVSAENKMPTDNEHEESLRSVTVTDVKMESAVDEKSVVQKPRPKLIPEHDTSEHVKKTEAKHDVKKDEPKSKSFRKGEKKSRPEELLSDKKRCTLWVGGLSSLTRSSDLKSLFSKIGKVVGARVFGNSKPAGVPCHGFVTVDSVESMKRCIQYLNRSELHGHMICVEKARNHPGYEDACESKRNSSDTRKSSSSERQDDRDRKCDLKHRNDREQDKKTGNNNRKKRGENPEDTLSRKLRSGSKREHSDNHKSNSSSKKLNETRNDQKPDVLFKLAKTYSNNKTHHSSDSIDTKVRADKSRHSDVTSRKDESPNKLTTEKEIMSLDHQSGKITMQQKKEITAKLSTSSRRDDIEQVGDVKKAKLEISLERKVMSLEEIKEKREKERERRQKWMEEKRKTQELHHIREQQQVIGREQWEESQRLEKEKVQIRLERMILEKEKMEMARREERLRKIKEQEEIERKEQESHKLDILRYEEDMRKKRLFDNRETQADKIWAAKPTTIIYHQVDALPDTLTDVNKFTDFDHRSEERRGSHYPNYIHHADKFDRCLGKPSEDSPPIIEERNPRIKNSLPRTVYRTHRHDTIGGSRSPLDAVRRQNADHRSDRRFLVHDTDIRRPLMRRDDSGKCRVSAERSSNASTVNHTRSTHPRQMRESYHRTVSNGRGRYLNSSNGKGYLTLQNQELWKNKDVNHNRMDYLTGINHSPYNADPFDLSLGLDRNANHSQQRAPQYVTSDQCIDYPNPCRTAFLNTTQQITNIIVGDHHRSRRQMHGSIESDMKGVFDWY